MVSWPAAFSGSWSGAHSGERPASVASSVGVLVSLVSSVGALERVVGGGGAAVVVLRRAGHQRDQDEGQDGEAGTKAHVRDRRAAARAQTSMSRPGRKPGLTCAARARRSSRSACQVWPESVRRST